MVTIQKILIDHNRGSRYKQWLTLEPKYASEGIQLSGVQLAYLKDQSLFKKQQVESEWLGKLTFQDTFSIGTLKDIGKIYLYTVVGAHGSYTFGFLHTTKQPEALATVV